MFHCAPCRRSPARRFRIPASSTLRRLLNTSGKPPECHHDFLPPAWQPELAAPASSHAFAPAPSGVGVFFCVGGLLGAILPVRKGAGNERRTAQTTALFRHAGSIQLVAQPVEYSGNQIPSGYCTDCLPSYKARMQSCGRCQWPATTFVFDSHDGTVIGVRKNGRIEA